MDAEESLGTGGPSPNRNLPPGRVDPDFYHGRPIPTVRREEDPLQRVRPRKLDPSGDRANNLAASFPLFFFGAGCIAVAAFVLLEGSHAGIGRIPLWVPFIALGIIALAGGTLSVFAEPDEPGRRDDVEAIPQSPSRRPAPLVPRNRSLGDRPRPAEPVPPVVPHEPAESPEPSDTRPPWLEELTPPPVESSPAPPAPVEAASINNDDTAALLAEIDAIDKDIHTSKLGSPYGRPETRPSPRPSEVPTSAPSVSFVPSVGNNAAGQAVPAATPRMESEVPRQVARCAGCGSVILHSGMPSQCQVCGEPLCSDCRDRSLSEGKPDLCPLCSLLDTVHSKGSTAPSTRRSRS
jgi:hypothetical protein